MHEAKPADHSERRTSRVGYARVSEDEQHLYLQLDALKAAGCRRIFCDEGMSGDAPHRPALEKAVKALRPGDMFVTWKLDRLGRSLEFLIGFNSALRAKHARFHSLTESMDTRTPGGLLLYHIIGAVSEYELAVIRERTAAGMVAAQSRGRRLGRPPLLTASEIGRCGGCALRTRRASRNWRGVSASPRPRYAVLPASRRGAEGAVRQRLEGARYGEGFEAAGGNTG